MASELGEALEMAQDRAADARDALRAITVVSVADFATPEMHGEVAMIAWMQKMAHLGLSGDDMAIEKMTKETLSQTEESNA